MLVITGMGLLFKYATSFGSWSPILDADRLDIEELHFDSKPKCEVGIKFICPGAMS